MNKLEIRICSGTTCYVLGGSQLLLLEDTLPPEIRSRVDIKGDLCLGFCRQDEAMGKPPFVTIGGESFSEVTMENLIKIIQEKLKLQEVGHEDRQ